MPLNPEVWLPHLEFMLQTISILYPQYPNDVTKKKYYDTIQNLPVFFPQFPIGKEFAKLLPSLPFPRVERRLQPHLHTAFTAHPANPMDPLDPGACS